MKCYITSVLTVYESLQLKINNMKVANCISIYCRIVSVYCSFSSCCHAVPISDACVPA